MRHSERRQVFSIPGLKRLAAAAVDRNVQEVMTIQKLGEGGFNRTFLITMNDGFQLVGRIPYTDTEPKHLVIASEVATMDFLRMNEVPVPKIYSYTTTSENAAGTEYIFMEFVQGTKLGDIWYDLPEGARIAVVKRLVELESRLFALSLPANGSLYYNTDLDTNSKDSTVPTSSTSGRGNICIGPDTRLNLWYGRRKELEIDRGPCAYGTGVSDALHTCPSDCANPQKVTDPVAVLVAGAKKEIAYLSRFGRPLHPIQRLHREIYNFQKLSPSEHLQSLEKYLQIVRHIAPNGDETLTRPTLRHPDLQPNNVFVSDNLSITGLIDWQHCAALPLFLQCGIPNSLQNYGDSVSESLVLPEVPEGFDDLSEETQFEQVLLLRRRQLHYFYVAETAKQNPIHYNALSYDFSALRRKIYVHSSAPWEGDSISLRADLVELQQKWDRVRATSIGTADQESNAICPLQYTEEEIKECTRLRTAQMEADEQLETCRDIVGVGTEGWVPLDQYDETKQRADNLKAAAVAAAETEEERKALHVHWFFDDFDESEYM